ncbi:hypothetical protein HMPREF9120_00605, partial [Neisseria sp. oral taxon 020 str. F0370]
AGFLSLAFFFSFTGFLSFAFFFRFFCFVVFRLVSWFDRRSGRGGFGSGAAAASTAGGETEGDNG